MRFALLALLNNAECSNLERGMMSRSEMVRSWRMIAKGFFLWRQVTEARLQMTESSEKAIAANLHTKCVRAMELWMVEVYRQRAKEWDLAQAISMDVRHLKTKMLGAWKRHTVKAAREKKFALVRQEVEAELPSSHPGLLESGDDDNSLQ